MNRQEQFLAFKIIMGLLHMIVAMQAKAMTGVEVMTSNKYLEASEKLIRMEKDLISREEVA